MFEWAKLKINSNGRAMARWLLLVNSLMIPLVGFNVANAGSVDISSWVGVKASSFRLNHNTGKLAQIIMLTNISKQVITGGLHLVFEGLNQGVQVSSGMAAISLTVDGLPVLQLEMGANAVFKPNEKFRLIIYFDKPSKGIIHYRLKVLTVRHLDHDLLK